MTGVYLSYVLQCCWRHSSQSHDFCLCVLVSALQCCAVFSSHLHIWQAIHYTFSLCKTPSLSYVLYTTQRWCLHICKYEMLCVVWSRWYAEWKKNYISKYCDHNKAWSVFCVLCWRNVFNTTI